MEQSENFKSLLGFFKSTFDEFQLNLKKVKHFNWQGQETYEEINTLEVQIIKNKSLFFIIIRKLIIFRKNSLHFYLQKFCNNVLKILEKFLSILICYAKTI